MGQRFDLIRQGNALTKALRQQIADVNLIDLATKLIKEEFNKFVDEMANKGYTGVISGVTLTIERESQRRYSVYVPDDDGEIANIVFNVLDSGRPALGPAKAYGYKAWPLHNPRQYPNKPMTRPGSAVINTPIVQEELVFRPSIDKAIEPRNLMKEVLRRAEKRLQDDGFGPFISIKLSEK